MTIKTIKISDCMDVQPGMSIKQRLEHDADGEAQVLTPAHLSGKLSYSYNEQHLLRMNLTRSVSKYEVRSGDVVFISRGQTNYSSYIDSVPSPTVINNTIYRLRSLDSGFIDPLYVAWSLNQAPLQAAISMIRTGSGAPIVQRKNFCDLVIPLPSIERQRQLAELGQLLEEQELLYQQLLDNTKHYSRAIGQQCLTQLSNANPESVVQEISE